MPVKFGLTWTSNLPLKPDNCVKFKFPYKLSSSNLSWFKPLKLFPLISIVLIPVSEVNPVYVIEFPAVWVTFVPLFNFQETRLVPLLNEMSGSKELVDPLFWNVKTLPILFLAANCCLLIF